jgi:hypothetical protein
LKSFGTRRVVEAPACVMVNVSPAMAIAVLRGDGLGLIAVTHVTSAVPTPALSDVTVTNALLGAVHGQAPSFVVSVTEPLLTPDGTEAEEDDSE